MRKTSRRDVGFFITLILNLILNIQWLATAMVFFIIHKLVDEVPLWPTLMVLGFWFGSCLIITWTLVAVSNIPSAPEVPKKNVNPYSKHYSTSSQTTSEGEGEKLEE